jgi:putative transcriptional regulator
MAAKEYAPSKRAMIPVAVTNVDSVTMARRLRFGDNVRRYRHAHGMSQEQLADKAGMDRKTVNRIEQGVHSVRLDNVWLLSEALEVDVRDLFAEPQGPGRYGQQQQQQQPQVADVRGLGQYTQQGPGSSSGY